VRSLVAVAVFGLGVIITSGLSALVALSQTHYGLASGTVGRILTAVLAAVVNVGIFTAAFRYLTVKPVSIRDVLPGAIGAGVAWQLLQSLGSLYVDHKLRNSSDVYGTFGIVLGLIAWIYLEALVVVLCAELNVVRRRHLWPRALLTPFTDNVSLTKADKSAYDSYAQAQQHKGFETIDVDFDDEDGEE
jgi:membrane protein